MPTKRFRLDPKKLPRLKPAQEKRLAAAKIDYSDIPPLDDKVVLSRASKAWPPAKKQLTIRLDADVLQWLKSRGRGYQTRINHILRAVMETKEPR
jgi:uncharacterized protein (DUF4415 family)